jgi:hypothetical protein
MIQKIDYDFLKEGKSIRKREIDIQFVDEY